MYHRGPLAIFMFFTNWAILLTAIYMIVSIYALKPDTTKSMLSLHHLLFEISLTANVVVTIVYWPFLAKSDLARPEVAESWVRIIINILMHIVPLCASYYNLKTVYALFKRNHYTLVWPIVSAYLIINYYATCSLG